jgi:hypothetical protein
VVEAKYPGLATIGIWWQGHRRQEVQVTDEHISVKLVENLVTRMDFNNHLESNRREFDKIGPAGRDENTAIRHEIAAAVQHSQEMLMDKLEKNRRELSDKLDHIPSRNHRRPEQRQRAVAMTVLKPSLFLDNGEIGRIVLDISDF